MLPSFIVIGAARSGSTWIFKNLAKHPEVFVPREKELHFFDRHYDRGLEFYESCFASAKPGQTIGEVTPRYLQEAEVVAPRIKACLPNVKLVACLRNPVDRLYSRYWNARGRFPHRRNLEFEQKLEQQPDLVREGFYADQLKIFMALFPQRHLLVTLYDDLSSDPREFIAKIYRFIGVDDHFVSDVLQDRINAATMQPLTVKSRPLHWASRALRRLDMNAYARWIEQRNSGRIPPLPAELRRKLTETYYGARNRELERLLGRSLRGWDGLDD